MKRVFKRDLTTSGLPFQEFLRGEKISKRPNDFLRDMHSRGISEALYEDQHGKCYICERRLCSDMCVDHFYPFSKDKSLGLRWDNLMMSCTYCNLLKGKSFDKLLNPAEHDVCREIRHKVSFEHDLFYFEPTDRCDRKQVETARLLDLIYNGDVMSESVKRRNVHNYCMGRLRDFRDKVDSYDRDRSELNYLRVRDELGEDSELLSFKYWMLKGRGRFERVFGDMLDRIR